MLSRKRLLALSSLFLYAVTSATAHHSFAVFDHTRTITLKGKVTKFQWTNPHGFIEMDVTEANGSAKHYSLELTSINMMKRLGWRSDMIKFGDEVSAVAAPLLSGQPAGLLLEITLPNGQKWEPGVPGAGGFKRTPEQD